MGNDIEIRVRVANNTATGLTAVNNSLNRLRDEARDAGRSLDGLTARAAAATVALRSLKDAAQDASRALRSLNVAARNADGRLDTMAQRSRTLRRDTDDLDGSMRSLTTTLGGLRTSSGSINLNSTSNGMNGLRKAALLLSPALIPIAAAAAPIAMNLGAAGVAVGAFGLAIAGQVSAIGDASDAQKKYDEAVKQYGQSSEQATKAEAAYLAQVKQLDPATRRSAAALSVLKDQYKQWSRDLAGDTMPVFTKGMANLGAVLPKMAPLVRSTSAELDRLMTVLAGGINSNGFSEFMTSFSEFASGALSKATDGLVRFMRTMSGGGGSSQLTEFMAYVREVGPQVGETLGNLGRALTHLVAAASDVGVSILTAVNAFAKLVNAIPTETLGNLLQFVLVFKAVQMAAAGLGGAGGAMAAFGTSLAAMSAASTAAGGGLAGLAAAFGALSRAAKVALIGSGIGILVVALASLSEMGKKAPPDIDKMTTSLRQLGSGGLVAGEAARVLGDDLSGLGDALQKVTDPKGLDQVQQSIVSFFGTDSTPVKDAKENIDALDKSLANLVKGGQADLAASALKSITAQMKDQGFSTKDITSKLDDYKASLADQAFEAQLAAQSMGLFGEQAAAVSAKLDGQKQSADGLRQSIEALNDVNRAALGGMIGFEASIDAAAKAAQENAGALSMTGGQLDVSTPKAQAAATALNDLAAKTKEAALANRESTGSWEGAIGIYERGRQQFIASAEAMGLTTAEAKTLAQSIMQIPDKTATLKMNTEDARTGLEAFNAAVKKTPSAKSVTLQTLSKGAESILEAFGMKVKRLPNGKVTVTAKNGQALSGIANVSGALARLDGRTATTYLYNKTINTIITQSKTYRSVHDIVGRADGGLLPRYADGDQVQVAPNGLLRGPGSGRSDDILAMFASGAMGMVSNTEFVVNANSTKRYLPLLEAINKNQLKLPGFASGGLTSGQVKGLYQSKDMAGLTSTLSDVRTRIKDKTGGATESRLLRTLDSVGKKLITHEKALIPVNKALDAAKTKLNDLKTAAANAASSVKSGLLGEANITKGAGAEDSRVTINTILSRMNASVANTGQFDSALKTLKGRGLSSTLLQQVADAGVEGGGLETAQALMGASSGQIKSLNSMQSRLTTSAASAGKTTADALYATAIRTQTTAVTKLTRSQDKLENAMAKLAKSLDKAVGRAIGKKASGGIVGAAASGGIRGGLTWVGEHEPELLQLPVGSRVWSGPDSRRKAQHMAPWASMLNTPRRTSAGSGGGGGGMARPIIVHQTITLDGKVVARQIFDPLREEIHHRGGNVQSALGK